MHGLYLLSLIHVHDAFLNEARGELALLFPFNRKDEISNTVIFIVIQTYRLPYTVLLSVPTPSKVEKVFYI
jgi:hypothetical protein